MDGANQVPRTGDLTSGTIADRYVVRRVIGAGGSAYVYLATDITDERAVAIKVLRIALVDMVGEQRFRREIGIARNLSHPHIVPVLDAGETDGRWYCVMPYVAGESLRARLTSEIRLPVEEALRIVNEVGGALEYAHSRGIVHRDIKPDNILLDTDGALVADFGIAKALDVATAERITTGNVVLGTILYMSPEQASISGAVDARSDLYALALVLYEMLTGDVPFRAPTADGVLARKASGQYLSVRVVRNTVPTAVDAALQRALSPIPADRFASVGEFLAALQKPDIPVRKRRVWRRWAVGGGALVAAAVAGLVIARFGGGVPATGPGRILIAPLENRTNDAALDLVGVMAADWATEGLQRAGMPDIVPTSTAIDASRFVAASKQTAEAHSRLRSLADETGARTVVTGAVYRDGDTLRFKVQVSDQHGAHLLGALPDIAAPATDPMQGIRELRTRLMGWLALQFTDRLNLVRAPNDAPPTYEAYKAFAVAMTSYIALENARAAQSFAAAYSLDTTFTVALLYQSICLTNLGRWASADSLLRVVGARRNQLSAYDAAWLDYRAAFLHDDPEGALTAIRAAARQAPESKAAYNHAVTAFQTGHIHEADAAIQALSPDRGPMRDYAAYWSITGEIEHALGHYGRERDAGITAHHRFPDRLSAVVPLVRSLAAQNRLAELRDTLASARRLPAEAYAGDIGGVLFEVAEEVRAHVSAQAAAPYYEETRTWLQQNASARSASWRLVQTLYATGMWNEARTLLAGLRERDSASIELVGMAGLLDARTGDRAGAASIQSELAARDDAYQFGLASVYVARIAALLGDRDTAVAALNRAIRAGRFHLWIHRDIDLQSLHGYAPFDLILRGRD